MKPLMWAKQFSINKAEWPWKKIAMKIRLQFTGQQDDRFKRKQKFKIKSIDQSRV